MTNGMILTVEDEKNIANLVKYNLGKDGFKCIVTTNGKEALAILIKQPIIMLTALHVFSHQPVHLHQSLLWVWQIITFIFTRFRFRFDILCLFV